MDGLIWRFLITFVHTVQQLDNSVWLFFAHELIHMVLCGLGVLIDCKSHIAGECEIVALLLYQIFSLIGQIGIGWIIIDWIGIDWIGTVYLEFDVSWVESWFL